MAALGKREVDWALVEEELLGIDNTWKETRFDTLPHVVDVLTCRDPREALDALRKQRDAIDVLVDDVVSIYYVGFNKAIHNYSQILSLISESAELMTGLKDSLAEARRLLGNRHKQLQQLWFRSFMLRHIIALIDQIDTISKVPGQIEQLVKDGKLYAAVQLHLHSVSSLERDGISAVGGLREVRHELSNLRGQLFIRVVDELQLHLYGNGEYSPKAEVATTVVVEEDDSDISNIVPVPVPLSVPLHPSLVAQGVASPAPRSASKYKSAKSVRGAKSPISDGKGGLVIDTSLGEEESEGGTLSPKSETSGTASLQGSQSATEGMSTVSMLRRPAAVLPKWLEDSKPDQFTDFVAKMAAPADVKYLYTMVECLASLGKIAAGGTIISQRVRTSVRDLICNIVRDCAAAAEAARPRVEQVTKQRHVAVSPNSIQASTSVLLSSTPTATPRGGGPSPVQGGLQAPTSHSGAAGGLAGGGGLTGGASSGSIQGAPGGSGGSVGIGSGEDRKGLLHDPNGPSQLSAQQLLQSVTKRLAKILESHVLVAELMETKAALAAKGTVEEEEGPHGPDGEVAKFSASTGGYSTPFVWSCIQTECQQLLCDMLKANADGTSSEASSRIQKIRLTMGSSNEVRFSFKFSDNSGAFLDGALPSSVSASRRPGGAASSPTMGMRPLGGNLTTAASTTTSKDVGFGTSAVLHERGIYLTSACYRPTLQFTEKVSQMLPKQYADLGRVGLRTFIDAFVKDQFLPSVKADYRAQAAEALSSPSAFRPKAKAIGVYESRLDKGRPVLQGPLAVEALAQEVLKWAVAMPVYASELVSLIHALFERSLERCRAVYTECVLGSLSSTLVGRPDLDSLQAQQAAAQLLDPIETLGKAEMETAKEDPHPDSEAYDLDSELYQKLFALQPLREEQLIMDAGKLVVLSALSDTLEYIADGIVRLGRDAKASDAQSARKSFSAHSHSRKADTPQALTPALQSLAEKCRGLAREALRTLRLEMQLHCIYNLQCMAKRSYVNEVDAEEPEDFIVSLTSQMTRVDEETSVYVSPPRRYYIFGGVCGLAAFGLIKALEGLTGINSLGVRQVQRNCIALQQTLTTLNANSSQSVQLSLDRVGEYYELLNRPCEALFAYVKDHIGYFSPEEYKALLKAHVPGRAIPAEGMEQMDVILQSY